MVRLYSTRICFQSVFYLYVLSYAVVQHDVTGAVVVVIAWLVDLQPPVQSVPITTKVVSSNPINGDVNSIQHFVMQFVSDVRQVLQFPPPIKQTATIYLKYC